MQGFAKRLLRLVRLLGRSDLLSEGKPAETRRLYRREAAKVTGRRISIARPMLVSLAAFLLAAVSVHAHAQEGNTSRGHCEAEFRKCDRLGGACVWLGIPLDVDCDRGCQIRLMTKIQQQVGTGVRSSASKVGVHGCVGFRTDLDGTADGAMCLAKHLGYRYDPVGCNVSGWAYNVIAQ
jgi:hypothetical protein